MSVTERTLQMLSLLNQTHGRALTKERLAEELGISEKTVRREVESLKRLAETDLPNCPVTLPSVEMELRDGRSYVTLQTAPPTPSEIYQYAAVYTAVAHLTVVEDEVLGGSALDALAHRFGAAADSELVSRVRRGFYYRPLAPKRYDEHTVGVLEDVIFGVIHSRPLKIQYRSLRAKKAKAHYFEPYTLVMFRDGFYALGSTNKGLMLVAIERIAGAKVLKKQSFEVPDSFDPEAYFGDSFGIWLVDDLECIEDVQLAFDAEAARNAKDRDWPGQVSWDALADGRQMLTLRQAATESFIAWILGWRSQVEVLAPEHLRERVRDALFACLEQYAE